MERTEPQGSQQKIASYQLGRRYNEIDIICILPIWPETFSYTVSEAWLNGIPIVATDIGAVGERIRKTGGGWLVKPDASPDEVMQLLHHIIDHPEEYQAKKEIVDDMEMKTVEYLSNKKLLRILPCQRIHLT